MEISIDKIDDIKSEVMKDISRTSTFDELNNIYINLVSQNGLFNSLFSLLKTSEIQDKKTLGQRLNKVKNDILKSYTLKREALQKSETLPWIDVTWPSKKPKKGNLHIVTHAIEEISQIFQSLGFYRMRYPEIEWDYYSFTGLNFPNNHPARDDFETFFIDEKPHINYGKMLLSPHTSSGQIREMKRKKLPIKMINIAKCYRRNWDISHTPMFHQFEGLCIEKGINISHLKGTMDFFAKNFFGNTRKTRLRPFHFQFTEPSFEVDISCGICNGSGKLKSGEICRTCKQGWLELGGSGMVHPEVLKNGGIDPKQYTGFAFGWGVERTYMMKQGLSIDDIRLLYSNDVRFLKQF